jgi:hypothetical protein
MAQTTRGYPYPDDYSAVADTPAALQALAVAINTDVDGRALAHVAHVTDTAAALARIPKIISLTSTIPGSELTAAAAKTGKTVNISFALLGTITPSRANVQVTRWGGVQREWTASILAVNATSVDVVVSRVDSAEVAASANLKLDVLIIERPA